MNEMAPEIHQTRQMGGLQLLTTQKKTVPGQFNVVLHWDAAARGQTPACDPWEHQLGPVIYPNIQMLPLGCPVHNFVSSVTQPNSQTPAHISRKELFCTSAPSLLFHKATPAHLPSSLVTIAGVNCCLQQLCWLSTLSLICCADRGLKKLFPRTT